jgi:hypothetical protein
MTHPHPNPPLEGEGTDYFSPFKGEIERGMGSIESEVLPS